VLRQWLAILFLAFAFVSPASAQRALNWRVFKASDGLAESFITSVSVSPRTNVWVKHYEANSVSVLNGYKSRTIPAPGTGYYRVIESRSGQIWAAYPEGLQEYKDNAWIKYPVKQIRQEFQTNLVRHARSIPLFPLRQGRVLFLVSEGLMLFNVEWPPEPEITPVKLARDTQLGRFNDMAGMRDGTIWISGEHGLARLSGGSPSVAGTNLSQFIIPPSLQIRDLHQPFPDEQGGVVATAESTESGRKVAVHFDGARWHIYHAPDKNLRQAWRGYDGSLWAITITSLLRLDGSGRFVESDEVAAGYYFDVATEPNGVFWLATSEGLFRFAPLTWRNPLPAGYINGSVHAMAEDDDGRVFIGFAHGLARQYNGNWSFHSYPEAFDEYPDPGDSIFLLPNKKLAIEANERLLLFDPGTGTFNYVSHASGFPMKLLGLTKAGVLCVQLLENPRGNRPFLQVFDGRRFEDFSTVELPAPSETEFYFLFNADNGDTWLGTTAGLWQLHEKEWIFWSGDQNGPTGGLCMIDAGAGKIWCGARDGLWEFDGKAWTTVRTDIDRVNALAKTRDGTIWAASNSGLWRFVNGEWGGNTSDNGLPSLAVTRVFEDRRGRLWSGTTRGLVLYHPESDLDPPRTTIGLKAVSEDGSITIPFSGIDKWKATAQEQLQFSIRLDEQEWTPFQPYRSVTFPSLSAGKHYFQVRSMDRNWNVDPKPMLLEFEIPTPWYQEARLLMIAVAGLATALFFAALAFNRHRRLLRSYAEVEKIVALRTHQLQEANTQLLHSQKMTALGTLAAGVAHDFNSILSIIKGSAQIIETNLQDEEKIRTRTERINTVVEQGSELVKAMLGFSRPGGKEMEWSDVNAITADTIKLLGDRFQRDVHVALELERNLPAVCLSKSSTQQILLNLIFNAADAVNGRGKIVIRTGKTSEALQKPVLSPPAASEYVFLAVQDYGSGIAPDILPRIFEPFFTTKAFSSRRGTGLGLSIVYELAKQMDCGLAVESQPGQGSTFTLSFAVPNGSSNDEKSFVNGSSNDEKSFVTDAKP
jgi:signal transduction histidine kinase